MKSPQQKFSPSSPSIFLNSVDLLVANSLSKSESLSLASPTASFLPSLPSFASPLLLSNSTFLSASSIPDLSLLSLNDASPVSTSGNFTVSPTSLNSLPNTTTGTSLSSDNSETETCYFANLPYALVAMIVARLPRLEDTASVLCTSHWLQSAISGAPLQLCVASNPVEDIYKTQQRSKEHIKEQLKAQLLAQLKEQLKEQQDNDHVLLLSSNSNGATTAEDGGPFLADQVAAREAGGKAVENCQFLGHEAQDADEKIEKPAVFQSFGNRLNTSGKQLDASWVNNMLVSVIRYMPAIEELDISGCVVTDAGVAMLVTNLQHLDRLILDNCQKISSSLIEDFAKALLPVPRTLSLERCFGLSVAAVSSLLRTTGRPRFPLECLLCSHLEGLAIGSKSCRVEEELRNQSVNEMVLTGMYELLPKRLQIGGGLRVLVLHCCTRLDKYQLQELVPLCPQLEMLLLGGSGSGFDLHGEKVSATVEALVDLASNLKMLRLLEITFFGRHIWEAVRSQLPTVLVWDFSSSVLDAAEVVTSLQNGCKHSMAYFLGPEWEISSYSECPQLQNTNSTDEAANERDDNPEFLRDGGESSLSSMGFLSHVNPVGTACRNGVSDYNEKHIGSCLLSTAEEGLSGIKRREDKSAIKTLLHNWGPKEERDFTIAVKAAANCFDAHRKTPLHIAAIKGDPELAAGLLVLGASAVGVKDGRGASALFAAAEIGLADVVKVLLKGGADPLARNRAGENPLYIAALKGHASAVEAMLTHCLITGLPWLDTSSYGDGWTPLMAAAVADRQDVAEVILTTLNYPFSFHPSSNTSSKDYPVSAHEVPIQRSPESQSMLDAQNRYGQTALHIAARQDLVWFVEVLLRAGASPLVEDAYGLKASNIAAKEAHWKVLAILKAAEKATSPLHENGSLTEEISVGEVLTPQEESPGRGSQQEGSAGFERGNNSDGRRGRGRRRNNRQRRDNSGAQNGIVPSASTNQQT